MLRYLTKVDHTAKSDQWLPISIWKFSSQNMQTDRHSLKFVHLIWMVRTVYVTSISPVIQNNTYSFHFSHVWWNLWTLHGWQHYEPLWNFLPPVACDYCHGQNTTESTNTAATRQCYTALKHQNFYPPQHGIDVSQNGTWKYLITLVKYFQNCSDLTEAI